MGTGSNDAARGGTRRARLSIRSVASSISPASATATEVITSPIPIAVISIIVFFSTPSSGKPGGVLLRTFPMICSGRMGFSPIGDKFENNREENIDSPEQKVRVDA